MKMKLSEAIALMKLSSSQATKKTYNQEYYQLNKDRILARSKQYYAQHLDEKAAYRKKHKARRAAYNKQWYQEHKAQRAAYYKARRAALKAASTTSVLLLLSIALLSSGCIDQPATSQGPHSSYRGAISISGTHQSQSVTCSDLLISGSGNTITVLNSDIEHISISGSNHIIYIPSSANPQTSIGGDNNQIIRI